MDPNTLLRQLRQMAAAALRDADNGVDDAVTTELAETFTFLDEWITRGGFLPAAWAPVQDDRNVVRPGSLDDIARAQYAEALELADSDDDN